MPGDTPLLDKVRLPDDLRKLDEKDLPQFAQELRDEMINAIHSALSIN